MLATHLRPLKGISGAGSASFLPIFVTSENVQTASSSVRITTAAFNLVIESARFKITGCCAYCGLVSGTRDWVAVLGRPVGCSSALGCH